MNRRAMCVCVCAGVNVALHFLQFNILTFTLMLLVVYSVLLGNWHGCRSHLSESLKNNMLHKFRIVYVLFFFCYMYGGHKRGSGMLFGGVS